MDNPNPEQKSDSWNVAQGYTTLKILKPLVEMDKLVKIAIYGAENIEDSLMMSPDFKVQARIEAIKRLIDSLKEAIENSEFAMSKSGTNDILTNLAIRVQDVENVISGITQTTTDMRTNQVLTVINEEHFQVCLSELRDIKKEIPKPLNSNSLIFPTSDETDLDAIKKQMIEGG